MGDIKEKKIPEKGVSEDLVRIGSVIGPYSVWVCFLGTSLGFACSFFRGRSLGGMVRSEFLECVP